MPSPTTNTTSEQSGLRMPTELGELKKVVNSFMERFDNIENEIETLKTDQKELILEFQDKLDMKTLKQAIRTVKIKKKVTQLDAYESFVDILDDRESL
jgi:uncharacterized protein (UPF0335 family)